MTDKSKAHLASGIAFATFVPLVVLFRSLSIADFPPQSWLTLAYAAYFLLSIVFTHALVFHLHFNKRSSLGVGLSRQAPRYIDYLATTLLAIGAIQISHAEGWLARYIDQITDPTPVLIAKIDAQARQHLQTDCGKNRYFPPTYCNRLLEITKESELTDYVQRNLMHDTDFLEHPIGFAGTPPAGVIALYSPIRSYVRQFAAKEEYSNATFRIDRQSAWTWFTMLLLPLLVALRATKTSLEVFAELS